MIMTLHSKFHSETVPYDAWKLCNVQSQLIHILIRAEKEQWEGTKPGDILTLKWNPSYH